MKIAFLGKGGSGKSTLATALVRHLHGKGWRVLAIDADHNMDLSYNLGADPIVFLGSDPDGIKEYAGSLRSGTYAQALKVGKEKDMVFTLTPRDSYTAANTMKLNEGLFLMTAGPHTERVRSQEACSHSLAAPLKVYLPLLALAPHEAVVIDERAGTDPVATGILSGIDVAVIVREPTVHSARIAEQIAKELRLAGISYLILDNKIGGMVADAERMIAEVSHAASA